MAQEELEKDEAAFLRFRQWLTGSKRIPSDVSFVLDFDEWMRLYFNEMKEGQ